MKKAFLVMGAQRSGTSVASHLLSKFGIHFGDEKRFLQDNHNPNFFELKWVNQYNDRLIRSLGYKYTDFFLPIEADYDSSNVSEVVAELPGLIEAEWGDEGFIGIKDPRFSLTFPVWEKALREKDYALQIIFVFRSPNSFLRSNQKLLNNWPGWDTTRHFHFWLQLNLAGIYFTRNYPIYFVSYDDVMNQPMLVSQQLAESFQFREDCINDAACVVNQNYQHHRESTETGNTLVDHYYNLLCTHQISAEDYLCYRHQMLAAAS